MRKTALKEKKKKTKVTSEKKNVSKTEKPRRAGLPAPDSIISEVTFTSPKGNKYRIIKTTEQDAYDKNAEVRSK
jgi:hypothetical protein